MSQRAAHTKRPRVLMAATSFPRDDTDWKGRFIYDQAAAIDRLSTVCLRLWSPPGELPGAVVSADSPTDTKFLGALLDAGGIAHLLRQRPIKGLAAARRILTALNAACLRNPVDVYHLNWLQLALALPDDRRPAYVSVLGSDLGLLKLPGMAWALRRVFKRHPVLLAPNADWMTIPLKSSFGDIAEIKPNPFGVDASWFGVERTRDSSEEWLVVSRLTTKKLGTLFSWGDGLFGEQRTLTLLGPMQEQINLPSWIHYPGATNLRDLREKWFPRAKGLLTLSRHHEGRPQVLIEAMASGLPVIASRLHAHTDLIRHRETGWLVESRAELVNALTEARNPEIASRIGENARSWVREKIGTWDDCAARCVSSYAALLERGQPSADD
jgi:glycosyltransferase involved in cell wall biosynthesis